MNIIPPVAAQVDFIKDLLQVVVLTLAVGGTRIVLAYATSFSSVVRLNFLSNYCLFPRVLVAQIPGLLFTSR